MFFRNLRLLSHGIPIDLRYGFYRGHRKEAAMVAENECLKNEEGPFPEPTPEERDLPLGKRGGIGGCTILES